MRNGGRKRKRLSRRPNSSHKNRQVWLKYRRAGVDGVNGASEMSMSTSMAAGEGKRIEIGTSGWSGDGFTTLGTANLRKKRR